MSASESKRDATVRSVGDPLGFEVAGQHLELKDSKSKLRLQYLARRIHALGEKPLFYLLDDLERGADLRNLLDEYASLPADFVRAYGGDKFGPPVFLLKEGGE